MLRTEGNALCMGLLGSVRSLGTTRRHRSVLASAFEELGVVGDIKPCPLPYEPLFDLRLGNLWTLIPNY